MMTHVVRYSMTHYESFLMYDSFKFQIEIFGYYKMSQSYESSYQTELTKWNREKIKILEILDYKLNVTYEQLNEVK